MATYAPTDEVGISVTLLCKFADANGAAVSKCDIYKLEVHSDTKNNRVVYVLAEVSQEPERLTRNVKTGLP